jgi:hypothetical protein
VVGGTLDQYRREDEAMTVTNIAAHTPAAVADPPPTPPASRKRRPGSPHRRRVWALEAAAAVAADRVRLRTLRARSDTPLPRAEVEVLCHGIEDLLTGLPKIMSRRESVSGG